MTTDHEGNPATARILGPEWAFLQDEPHSVAPQLLGRVIQHAGVAVRITEVEAYNGSSDPGSHAYRGKTERNSALFGPPGTAYVYMSYGIHRALNMVCGFDGVAGGILLRSGEVVGGTEVARSRRGGHLKSDAQLARGPGNLGQALAVDVHLNGMDVLDEASGLRLRSWQEFRETQSDLSNSKRGEVATGCTTPNGSSPEVCIGPRVGVSGPGGDGGAFPWRFWLADDPTVSAYRAAVARVCPKKGER